MTERPGPIDGVTYRDLLSPQGDVLSLRDALTDDETPGFDGYACVWDVVDAYGTTFENGCFGRGGLDTAPYPLLLMHDPWSPIGVMTAAEDDIGLRITGTWDTTPEGQAARARAVGGSAADLSVGFRALAVSETDDTVITQAALVEVSQVTTRFGAVPGAQLTSARQIPVETMPLGADELRAIARLRLS